MKCSKMSFYSICELKLVFYNKLLLLRNCYLLMLSLGIRQNYSRATHCNQTIAYTQYSIYREGGTGPVDIGGLPLENKYLYVRELLFTLFQFICNANSYHAA